MTEIATIDWFGRLGTAVFSGNTAIFEYALTDSPPSKSAFFFFETYRFKFQNLYVGFGACVE